MSSVRAVGIKAALFVRMVRKEIAQSNTRHTRARTYLREKRHAAGDLHAEREKLVRTEEDFVLKTSTQYHAQVLVLHKRRDEEPGLLLEADTLNLRRKRERESERVRGRRDIYIYIYIYIYI